MLMDEFGKSHKGFVSIRKVLLFLVPFVYASILCFSLSDEWFPADDKQEMVFVRDAKTIWSLLEVDVFGLFRPVKNLVFVLFGWMLPAIGVRGCRIAAIAVGAISFFPVLALCRRIFRNERKAILATSIWLLSPTLVSSAAWLSAANIQIMVAFASLAIVFHDDAWNDTGRRDFRCLLAGSFLFMALISYECAISIPPILFLFDLLLRPGRIKNRKVWLAYVFYAITVAAYLILRSSCHASTQVNGSFVNIEQWQLVVSSPFFTGQHFLSWFWPFGRFTVFGSYKWGQASWTILVLCALLFVFVLAFAIAEWKRLSILSFCILFALFAFAPVSNCLGFGNGPYGDYYLSFSSIGISAGFIELCSLLLRRKGKLRPFAIAAVFIFASIRLLSLPEAVRWSRWWRSGERAYAVSIRNFPSFFYNKVVFAAFLFDSGRQDEALALGDEVEAVIGENAQQMSSIHQLRALYAIQTERNAEKALEEIDKSLRTIESGRALANAHYYRGCVFEDLKGDDSAAEREYELALAGKWDTDSVPCADRLARLKAIRGEHDAAIELWEKAMKLDPGNTSVLWNLSIAYRSAGDNSLSNELRERVRQLTEK